MPEVRLEPSNCTARTPHPQPAHVDRQPISMPQVSQDVEKPAAPPVLSIVDEAEASSAPAEEVGVAGSKPFAPVQLFDGSGDGSGKVTSALSAADTATASSTADSEADHDDQSACSPCGHDAGSSEVGSEFDGESNLLADPLHQDDAPCSDLSARGLASTSREPESLHSPRTPSSQRDEAEVPASEAQQPSESAQRGPERSPAPQQSNRSNSSKEAPVSKEVLLPWLWPGGPQASRDRAGGATPTSDAGLGAAHGARPPKGSRSNGNTPPSSSKCHTSPVARLFGSSSASAATESLGPMPREIPSVVQVESARKAMLWRTRLRQQGEQRLWEAETAMRQQAQVTREERYHNAQRRPSASGGQVLGTAVAAASPTNAATAVVASTLAQQPTTQPAAHAHAHAPWVDMQHHQQHQQQLQQQLLQRQQQQVVPPPMVHPHHAQHQHQQHQHHLHAAVGTSVHQPVATIPPAGLVGGHHLVDMMPSCRPDVPAVMSTASPTYSHCWGSGVEHAMLATVSGTSPPVLPLPPRQPHVQHADMMQMQWAAQGIGAGMHTAHGHAGYIEQQLHHGVTAAWGTPTAAESMAASPVGGCLGMPDYGLNTGMQQPYMDERSDVRATPSVQEEPAHDAEYQAAYTRMYQGVLAARLEAAAPEYYED